MFYTSKRGSYSYSRRETATDDRRRKMNVFSQDDPLEEVSIKHIAPFSHILQ